MSKGLIISHSYLGDGASSMLLEASSYWCKKLHWSLDALLPIGFSGDQISRIQSSGMNPVKNSSNLDVYNFILINCLQNIHCINSLKTNTPIIIWAHEAETVLQSNPRLKNHLQEYFSKASLIIFQTPWQFEVYRDYLINIPMEKIAFVPNGITKFNFPELNSTKTHNTFCITNLGKLTPLKGQADLIRSVVELAPHHNIACEFIGGIEFLDYLPDDAKEILKKNPQTFHFAGFLPRRSALERVAKSNLFCFPSQSESFGLAPLEASAYSVPVILAKLPVYELIGWRENHNCLMYQCGNHRALSGQIKRIIDSPKLAKEIANNGLLLANQYDSLEFLVKVTSVVKPFSG